MARSLRSFLTSASNFLSKLTGKKPKPPVVQRRTYQDSRGITFELPGAGHRGVAVGNTMGDRPRDLSAENIAKWHGVTGEELEDFVYNGQILFVHSTNVIAFQFFIENNTLMVEFKGKKGKPSSAYLYRNVTVEEAIEAVTSMSKGSFCWSRLRQRGSRTAHQKPYQRIR